MSKVKAGGSSKNNHDSPGQRRGVKIYGGQKARIGQIIVRQAGTNKKPGKGTKMGRDFTIHADKDGTVAFRTRKTRKFTGQTIRHTEVTVQ